MPGLGDLIGRFADDDDRDWSDRCATTRTARPTAAAARALENQVGACSWLAAAMSERLRRHDGELADRIHEHDADVAEVLELQAAAAH